MRTSRLCYTSSKTPSRGKRSEVGSSRLRVLYSAPFPKRTFFDSPATHLSSCILVHQLHIPTAANHHGRHSDIFACLSLHGLPPVFVRCLHTRIFLKFLGFRSSSAFPRLSYHFPLSLVRVSSTGSRILGPRLIILGLIRIDSQLAIGMPAIHHQSSSPFALALHTDSRPPSSSLQTTSNTVRNIGDVRNEELLTIIICFPLHGKVLALCSRMKLNACSSLRIQMILEKCDNLSMLR